MYSFTWILPASSSFSSVSLTIDTVASDVRKNKLAIYTAACMIYCCIELSADVPGKTERAKL